MCKKTVHGTKSEYLLQNYFFNQFRNETNNQVLEYLLRSLLTFCKSVAVDCRRQLCQLGEDIIPALLPIWSKRHPSIKVLILS